MYLKSVQLLDFRNYKEQNIDFQSQVNIFLGKNGQGKTNLLEGIFLLTKGQSFRPGKNTNFINNQPIKSNLPISIIRGLIVKNDLSHKVQIKLDPTHKSITVNDKRTNGASLRRHFPSILFSPESLSAIKEGPEQRRALVDDFLQSQSQRASSVIFDYKRALKTRNRVLKDFKSGFKTRAQTQPVLESINKTFLKLGTQLVLERIELIKALNPHMQEAIKYILNLENVDSSVNYLISSQSAIDWDENKVYDALVVRLGELYEAELHSGVSLIGPHKHDICFLFEGEDARFYCSQGQQRALILAFKMAQIRYHFSNKGEYPLLLLDDVLSELDEEKRMNLINFLKEIPSQIFITTTELSFSTQFENRNVSIYKINSGEVESSYTE